MPDYRDLCLPVSANPQQSRVDSTDGDSNKDDVFGCDEKTDLTLHEVKFPRGYSYLDIASRHSLDRLALALRLNDHYFEIGSTQAGQRRNLALSKKRAEAVRYYLLLRGVDPNRIRAKGYGDQYRIADNATVEGRQANRRVDITLLR